MSTNDSESWMGSKGFDEANYYKDEKSDIGLTHSDVKIEQKAIEFLDRNLSHHTIEVKVTDGVVTLSGEVRKIEDIRDAEKTVKNITGVKFVTSEIRLCDR
jgi:osmotically-inducible protein OsmY